MDLMNRPLPLAIVLAAAAILGGWVIHYYDGTGDAGDSIVHYQFARYAYSHPMNFLDNWAKPIFVLFAAPFAQFGFAGIKVFNLIVSLGTALLLFLILKQMKITLAWMSIPFLFSAPLFFVLIFSGLTEFLFAFGLVLGIYLALIKRSWASMIVISFLPFIRSEGLLVLPFFLGYALVMRQWLPTLGLLVGHIVYGILGGIFKGDVLWMFTQNPYAMFSNEYGSGDWFHFLRQMPYVAGIPLYVMFLASVVFLLLRLFWKKFRDGYALNARFWLMAGPFLAYFLAHVIFWRYGLFHSMGLKRVMIAIIPLMIIPVVEVLSMIYDALARKYRRLGALVVMLLFHGVVVFPLSSGPAAIHPEKDLVLDPLQQEALNACNQISDKWVLASFEKVYCSNPSMQLFLEIDPFNTDRYGKVMNLDADPAKRGRALIIWDCGYAKCEDGVSLEPLQSDTGLQLLMKFPEDADSPCFYVFAKKL